VASRKKPVSKLRMELLPPEEKIARMLGILATQNVKAKMDQVVLLRAGGFTNAEIGEMLDISENSVSVFIYDAKQKKGKKANATN